MDFGKLQDLRGVDFTLPPDHPRTGQVLRAQAAPAQMGLRLGATGWSNKEWVGKWYPAGIRQGDYLHYYAQLFDTIELNTTHYRIPEPSLVDRWREAVPPQFRFCPKVPQVISHYKQMLHCEAETDHFCEAVSRLEDRLGWSFIQLPPDFGPAHLPRLENYLRAFPRTVPLAVEFRHPAWFEESPITQAGFELLHSLGMAAVITDVAGRRDVLHMHLTCPTLILRFVGNLHPTDGPRLQDWARRLSTWKKQGLRDAYIFLHQPDMMQVPVTAQQWTETLNPLLDLHLHRPEKGDLEGQTSLF